jgi:hypothetical protein
MPVILATWKAETGRSWLEVSLGKKFMRSPYQPILVHTCHPSANRRIMIQAGLGIKVRSYLKNNEAKKGLGMWIKW